MGVLAKTPWVPGDRAVAGHRLEEWRNNSRERVAIHLDADCLKRLLATEQLHVEDFSCGDGSSKECVRRLLLQNVIGV